MHSRKHAQKLILFCEIWVLTPSFFDMSLRSHYPIFSPQIKQKNWLTYCSMKIQNYLKRQIRILIFRLFYVPISPTFCGQYMSSEVRKSHKRMPSLAYTEIDQTKYMYN